MKKGETYANPPILSGIPGRAEMTHIQFRWSLWINWLLVNLLGVAAGLTLGVLMGLYLYEFGNDFRFTNLDNLELISEFIGGAVTGAVIGVFQWLFLRRHSSLTALWVVSSLLSMALAFAVGRWLDHPLVVTLDFGMGFEIFFISSISYRLGDRILGLLAGITLGVGQWIVLRRQFRSAYWWIPANAFGLFIGFVLVWSSGLSGLLGRLYFRSLPFIGPIIRELTIPGAVIGLCLGILTGIVFFNLQPIQSADQDDPTNVGAND
jgi:hypothetical protein